jgi:hypothetical protein
LATKSDFAASKQSWPLPLHLPGSGSGVAPHQKQVRSLKASPAPTLASLGFEWPVEPTSDLADSKQALPLLCHPLGFLVAIGAEKRRRCLKASLAPALASPSFQSPIEPDKATSLIQSSPDPCSDIPLASGRHWCRKATSLPQSKLGPCPGISWLVVANGTEKRLR